MECFAAKFEGVASGTDKTFLNLFNPAATPTVRGRIYHVEVAASGTPGDQAAKLYVARTTAVGTEGSGFVPNNLDPAGPAGAYDAGIGTFSAEPTYTANKELLVLSGHQRASLKWVALFPGAELAMAATQNNGAGLKSKAATSTQAYDGTVFFKE